MWGFLLATGFIFGAAVGYYWGMVNTEADMLDQFNNYDSM